MIGTDHDVQSDAQLIQSAAEDPDAFRVLYGRYAGPMHAFFARRTGSADAALDLTAETFAQAWKSKRRFRDEVGGSAGPRLFAIARRVLMKSVARGRVEATMLERLEVELPPRDRSDAEPSESWLEGLDADVQAALASLPHDQRQAIGLRVVADLPDATIANRLDCTPTAARIRVSRGLATLRARLEGTQG